MDFKLNSCMTEKDFMINFLNNLLEYAAIVDSLENHLKLSSSDALRIEVIYNKDMVKLKIKIKETKKHPLHMESSIKVYTVNVRHMVTNQLKRNVWSTKKIIKMKIRKLW